MNLIDSDRLPLSRREFLRAASVLGTAAAGASLLAPRGLLGKPIERASLAAQVAKKGGTLHVAQNSDITGNDPQVDNLTEDQSTLWNVYEPLAIFDSKTLSAAPLLAESWRWSSDNRSLTFKLRRGVKFHSGRSFGAADVKYSFERVANPKLGSEFTPYISDVESVVIDDPYTVTFKTRKYSNRLIAGIPYIAIIPNGSGNTIKSTPDGTGPFKWLSWVPGASLTMARNPNYWMTGRPLLDSLVFTPIEQQETGVEALLAGQQHILYDLAPQQAASLLSHKSIHVAATVPDDQPYLCYFNLAKPPFRGNVKLRQAFSTAIDRQAFVSKVLSGYGAVAYSPFAHQSWAFDSGLVGKYKYDLKLAAKLLAEAGYPGGRGLELQMLVPDGFAQFLSLSELIQGAMAKLGVKVNISQLEASVWFSQFSAGKYDVLVNTDVDHSSDPALTFAQPYLWLPGAENYSHFTSNMIPGYVQLINEADAERDQAVRKGLYNRLQNDLMDNAITAMVAFTSVTSAVSNKVQGFVPAPQYHQRYDSVWLA